MRYGKAVTDVVKARFSCRTYRDVPLAEEVRGALETFLAGIERGPFGALTRFRLVAATEEDRNALRGLGTYGFIRGATGFVLGAVGQGQRNLEDFGYCMEDAVLYATVLRLGTCWLGGTFRKSSFASLLDLREEEVMASVCSVGYVSDQRALVDRLAHRYAGAQRRLAWERLFSEKEFGVPLPPGEAGAYAEPLEMVRLGPSASNKQPWRVVKGDGAWHFYLQRTPGYDQGMGGLFMASDLQRVDMGIALFHFEQTAREAGLAGRWVVDEPGIHKPDELVEYSASWIES
jgi:nitroreductase